MQGRVTGVVDVDELLDAALGPQPTGAGRRGGGGVRPRRQYATFLVDDWFLGVEVGLVQEVIRYQEMTRVPLASPVIAGLINLRGQIVTAIDLRRRLGLPDRLATDPSVLPAKRRAAHRRRCRQPPRRRDR